MIKQLSLAFVLVAVTSSFSVAQSRGPSTPEERQQLVAFTRSLEADPFGDKALDYRRWLVTFLTDVPDISVVICSGPIEPLLKSKKNYSAELTGQQMFGEAAFMVEHPDKATDSNAVQAAGLESIIATYQAILKTKPKATWPYLDDLISKRKTPEWAAAVNKLTGSCGK